MAQLPSSAPRLRSELRLKTAERFGAGLRIGRECACTLRRLVALLVLIVLPTLARPQDLPRDDYTINVNVDVVVLHATAQDHRDMLVSGLGRENFQVYEDGVLQPIKYFSHEDIPVTVGLVIDNSGSMK